MGRGLAMGRRVGEMAEDIEIAVNASPTAPKVIEIDARIIARLIVGIAHAREKPAAKAANAIVDYFALCIQDQRSVS